MRPLGQALIRSLRRTGGAEDTRPARPTDPIQGTRPVDPRVRPAERAPRPSSSQWIYSACLCFGLDADEQARSGFRYAYSVYQAEYSRNLLFGSGAQMDRVFNTLVDRTRSRLDVPMLRTLFGAKRRPGLGGSADLSPRLAAVIETPGWDLTLFKVHFGLLTLKGYTKGEHVLRFEAVVHNTKQLGCGRAIEKFPEIVTQLKGMAERFCTALDCVTTGFLPDGTLDALPLPSRIGRTRIGGIDLYKATDPGCAGGGPGVCRRTRRLHRRHLAAKVQAMGGQTGYTIRQAAYDLCKLRGHGLLVKPDRSRRYQVPPPAPPAARTIAALLTLRDQVIGPILAGVRSPRLGRKPAHWTAVDRDYETLRIGMQTLFADLGIAAGSAAA